MLVFAQRKCKKQQCMHELDRALLGLMVNWMIQMEWGPVRSRAVMLYRELVLVG